MVKIAVCDDEPDFVQQICEKIKNYWQDCNIKSFYSGSELLSEQELYDIYFLDIQMENINGIDTAKSLRKLNGEAVIVFISAAKEYVFEAFDVAALHYLVKPIDDEKLYEVIDRAKNEIDKKKRVRQILIKTKGKNIALHLEDVLFFENEMRKITAHTTKGDISFYSAMADIEKETGQEFYRCHRAYLVNLAYVSEYNADSVILTNGAKIYLPRNKYSDFVRQYMRYLRNGGVSHV